VLILLVLVGYMVTYQVSFDEVAVVTTFGKAETDAVRFGDEQAGGVFGNLHWKWPWPIQKVVKYDARVRVLDDRLEEQQTKDKQDVVIRAYVAWQIDEPLAFFRTLRNADEAETRLRARLRDARAEIGNFTFDQLTNVSAEKLALDEAEAAIKNQLQSEITTPDRGGTAKQNYGIAVKAVGIKQIILPQPVTEKVFNRMRSTRQRLAQRARSEGDAIANDIQAKADSRSRRIMSFANRLAESIRAEGDEAAAEYYETFQQNQDFAIFLRNLEALEQTLEKNTTFLLDTQIAPFDLFEEQEIELGPEDIGDEAGDDVE
jgi:membrane protease subunit HflC